tara:strand:+ start:142 stop:348 length:207 start_codon:yes stop_codon:yes gene_type:complete
MSRSAKSKLKVGMIRGIWNTAFKRMDYYLRSKRGRFILCNPYTGSYLSQGPGLAPKQMDRAQKRMNDQ